MTKQEFLSGKSFYLPYGSKENTYKCNSEVEYIAQEYRTKDGRVIVSDHLMNIEKIGNKMITCFTFVLDTKVVKKIRYEDMVEFISA